MPKDKANDQVRRIVAQLDGLFASDDVSPADQDRWQELKRMFVLVLAYPILGFAVICWLEALGVPPSHMISMGG